MTTNVTSPDDKICGTAVVSAPPEPDVEIDVDDEETD